MTETPGDQDVLHVALSRIRQITALPVAFGGTVAAVGGAARPVRSPRSAVSLRLTECAGTVTGALPGLRIVAGAGLGGRVLLTGQPGNVTDYAVDPRISHEYDGPVSCEGLRAIAAVPVAVGGEVLGLLYAGTREPLAVGERAQDAMRRVAAHAGTEWAVRREVRRRITHLETAALRREARDLPTAAEREELRQAHADLRSIAQEVTDPAVRARLHAVCDRLAGAGRAPATPNPLSPRELDVLAMVAVGCSNAETARRLGILPETAKSYLRSATRKLGTHGRMDTVVTARRHGYLP
ncbi:LuxR C-terminal-related transcriptional regulator [Mangrovihabitans endophyticus]|uniref:Helix-turn-helix transcriptional regulator n=1 Tax=Mangrovihabitans endophyticus TaxID=1751298 RepID=A0A8J3FQT7_9ACTN|nr:LuxR C-terminal-related transcriptional regulator [Mangrovihabitans endophyticus]GGL06125.1 helix-turn-helix transcriptional regulator [Mangrovihabitans endophyticus]